MRKKSVKIIEKLKNFGIREFFFKHKNDSKY